MTTTSAPEDVYCTSELSLVIDKADSIEEKDESCCSEKKVFSSDDIVIEEEATELEEEARERKKSVIEIRKSFESFDEPNLLLRRPSRCLEASCSPPTSISTQTIPTDEFPEVLVPVTPTNQSEDVRKSAQLNVETQQETKTAQQIDSKAKSRNEPEEDAGEEAMVADDEPHPFVRSEEQQQKQERAALLAHQQSMSQEDDFEVAMVSGLLPGCVAPAPTPAPSIAPLAEVEDPTEDDAEADTFEPKPEVERKKKRKERKEREGEAHGEAEGSSSEPDKTKRNAVCPWEDEWVYRDFWPFSVAWKTRLWDENRPGQVDVVLRLAKVENWRWLNGFVSLVVGCWTKRTKRQMKSFPSLIEVELREFHVRSTNYWSIATSNSFPCTQLSLLS